MVNRFVTGFGLVIGALLLAFLFPGSRLLLLLALLLGGGLGWFAVHTARAMERRTVFLEGTLDAVPQPITVTDLDMHWEFVNKTTEKLLKRTREEVKGRHCSEWQAHICNTDKCGITSLAPAVREPTTCRTWGMARSAACKWTLPTSWTSPAIASATWKW